MRRSHFDMPVVVAAGLDLALLALLALLLFARPLRLGAGQRHGGILPCLFHRMPSGRASLGRQPLGAHQLPHHARGLVRFVFRARVEEHLRAVAGDDHPAPQSPPRLVVEIERSQPLAERVAVVLVVQLNLDTPVFPAHRADDRRRVSPPHRRHGYGHDTVRGIAARLLG
jgi:hypothetical protein